MLKLFVVENEFFDESTQEFVVGSNYTLELEHSLYSLSKWESIFEKPFLGKDPKSTEELMAYVHCMILTKDVPDNIVKMFTDKQMLQINEYIDAKHTATWFSDFANTKPSREVITSELIYYWMFSLTIPIDCEHWNLNRLLTLIKIFQVKSQPAKKMSRSELAARNRTLNQQRRAQLGTSG